MAQLLVRDIDDAVRDALKERAAQHGRSMEAEIRSILIEATQGKAINVGRAFYEGFAELGGVDLVIPPREELPRAVTFD
jgi:plasmid stability protein